MAPAAKVGWLHVLMLWSEDMLSGKRDLRLLVVFIVCVLNCVMAAESQTVFVEAESFQSKGGWQVDQQ